MTTTETRKTTAIEALAAAHLEAHRLIEKLTEKIDSVDPDTANWGHVGDLNYIINNLRAALDEE